MMHKAGFSLRHSLKDKAPGLQNERHLWALGKATVVGIDEVGRGSWAGPLTLAGVVAPQDKRLYRVRDSKLLKPAERAIMFDRIYDWATQVAVAHASAKECDQLGMSAAQKLATQRLLRSLDTTPDHVLVDGRWDFVETLPTTTIVKGDTLCLSIAAASIVAKVTRDQIMCQWHQRYPEFNFFHNKGYPCPRHKAALVSHGPTAIHRQSWAFMDKLTK